MPGIFCGVKFRAHVFFLGSHYEALLDPPSLSCILQVPPRGQEGYTVGRIGGQDVRFPKGQKPGGNARKLALHLDPCPPALQLTYAT